MAFLIILRIFPHMFMLVTTSVHTAQKHVERISFMHCLVNTRKFVLRWNPLLVKMLSLSFDISMCIAMMKCIARYWLWETTEGIVITPYS